MIESTAFFRRSLHIVALALSSAVIAASATPASARSHHHGSGHHAHHFSHHPHRHAHHARRYVRASRSERGVAAMRTRGFERSQASPMTGAESSGTATSGGFGGSNVVAEARRYLGGN